jgi:hypothetical protein
VCSSNILQDFNMRARFVFFVKVSDMPSSFVSLLYNDGLIDIVDAITLSKVGLVSSGG